MNYYIIPKNNFNISINPIIKRENISPIISYSLIHHLNTIFSQILDIDTNINTNTNINTETTFEFINKIVNPFEFIHTNIPGSFLSVSKVKPSSNIFYELMEIYQVCSITESLLFKKQIHIAHITKNNLSTNYLMDMLRENNTDIVINEEFDYSNLCKNFVINSVYKSKMDVFIFEFNESDYINIHQYINNMILVLYIITKYQAENGMCIIKIDNIFYKTIVDILFIFSAIYEKVVIIKPSISKVTKGERYIICKKLNTNILTSSKLLQQLDTHIRPKIVDNTFHHSIIHSLIKNDIPYYFSNKIEEVNAVIGQQQLEAYDQILNILKGKNKTDKIEILKRNNIQKCIQWCEKNQLPHNKFGDKFNVFLNIQKKEHNMLEQLNIEDTNIKDTNIKDTNMKDTNTTLFGTLLNEINEHNTVICNANIDTNAITNAITNTEIYGNVEPI
jgi:hypothetical protein